MGRGGANGDPLDTRFRLRHAASNSWHLPRVRAVPLRHPDGTVRGWLGMNTDLEERAEPT